MDATANPVATNGGRCRPRGRVLAALLLGLCLLGLGPMVPCAVAADDEALADSQVLELMASVREKLPFAILSDGSHPAPETEAERAVPLLPVEDGRRVLYTGFNSGFAEWCGLDWEAHYLGFMKAERARQKWSDKQIAFIGMMHGTAMQMYADSVATLGRPCSPEEREEMRRYLEAGP